ncbi:MAG: hypothetical protein E2581_10665 [Pseudomonas sp.]|uniref:delta-60 repeat domain-containing protein n=1 Tax=Pseudomonas sp. TaxID=306 RepID=UPI001DF30AAE|nr:delta-60 repeat domain-containing protein [Pseudomonas sp.]MPS98947.1 hypothetical protein [Pseudomonas sp.]
MNTNEGAGYLDKSYGNQGEASVPPLPPKNPDKETLQVYPYTSADDGSMVFYGYDTDDVTTREKGVFTRLGADGQWDEATGHVEVSKKQSSPLPYEVFNFNAMTFAKYKNEERYLTASTVIYAGDTDKAVVHVAVGAYDRTFSPVAGFGDDGIALPSPPFKKENTLLPEALVKTLGYNEFQKAVDYRYKPKLALIGDRIITVFPGSVATWEAQDDDLWCALLDAATGAPVPGLGEDGKSSQLKLPRINGQALVPYHVAFMADGGFVVVGQADGAIHLQRYQPNALPDTSFGVQGSIKIPDSGSANRAGLAIHKDVIVASVSVWPSITTSTHLHGYTVQGEPIAQFTREVRGDLEGGQVFDHLQFDTQGRLLLAGTRTYRSGDDPEAQSSLHVARLNVDGTVDNDFGKNGFSELNVYHAAANGIHVDESGVRILTLMPITIGAFYEKVAKFQV